MKWIKIAATIITVFVLVVSLTVFPWLGTMYGWDGIGLTSLIITCIFVSVWLIVLLLAAAAKSKTLINIYRCYWLGMTGVHAFVLVFTHLAVFEVLAAYLFIFLVTPIIGIHYLIPSSWDVITFFVPLCMFLLGLHVKKRYIKEPSGGQSAN